MRIRIRERVKCVEVRASVRKRKQKSKREIDERKDREIKKDEKKKEVIQGIVFKIMEIERTETRIRRE